MGPQDSISLKYWANNDWIYDWPVLQYQDIAKNLTKGQFAQYLKNGSDINGHVHKSRLPQCWNMLCMGPNSTPKDL